VLLLGIPQAGGRPARSASAPRILTWRDRSLAEHISVTERTAADAEVDAIQMKKLEFFSTDSSMHASPDFSRHYYESETMIDGGTAGSL